MNLQPSNSENKNLHKRVQTHLLQTTEVMRRTIESCTDSILRAADRIVETFRAKGKVMLCGNGGSAADCQHMAAEFVSRLDSTFERPGLPAIALTTDTSFLTAFTNDYSYEGIFERQIQSLGRPGDVLIGISTSGNSGNILRAVEAARELGIHTIALTGNGGHLAKMVEIAISVPSAKTQAIQETHLAIEHIICDLVECQLFGKDRADA